MTYATYAQGERAADLAQQQLQAEQQAFTVQASPLDDAAEMRVYGSRGRIYYNPGGDVIAEADNVTPSRFDQIRRDESLDSNPESRRRLAEGYRHDIDDLTTNQGLNLFQAEVIAEGRLADRGNILRLTGRFMDGGETRGRFDASTGVRMPDNAAMEYDKARQRAVDSYQRKDASRVRRARLENPYTRADEQARIATERANRRGDREAMGQRAEGREQRRQEGRKRALNTARDRNRGKLTDDLLSEAYAVNEKYDRALAAVPHNDPTGYYFIMGESGNNYARTTAELRSGYLGRLEHGRHFGRRMRRRSEAADQRTETARTAFNNDLAQWADAYRLANGSSQATERRLLEHSLAARQRLQGRISQERVNYAHGDGGLRDRVAGFIGRTWSANRAGRFFKVAAPATALGAVLPVAGVYLGRKIGQGIAGAESRRRVTDDNYSQSLLDHERQGSKQNFPIDVDALLAHGETVDNVDVTQSIESTTTEQVQQNRRRRVVAGRVGALAATAGSIASGAAGGAAIAGHVAGTAHTTHTTAPLVHGIRHVRHARDLVDGYNIHVTVPQGAGYEEMLTHLAGQKGIHLTGHQSAVLYDHLRQVFPNDNFFTNDPAYRMAQGVGISHPGAANWNPAVVRQVSSWINHNAPSVAAERTIRVPAQIAQAVARALRGSF